jgi:hypothetical protein
VDNRTAKYALTYFAVGILKHPWHLKQELHWIYHYVLKFDGGNGMERIHSRAN